MLDSTQVAELLERGEGQRLACFRERFRPEELAETLVAFANGSGGIVLIGVSGRARPRPEGVADVAAAQEGAFDAALQCSPPLVLPLAEPIALDGATLLMLEVPSGLPQVYNVRGKYLHREGPANVPVPPHHLRRLLLERGEVSWDRTVPEDASIDELDPRRIAAYARRVGPAAEADPFAFLYKRGCLARSGDEYVPNNAGLLIFAHDTERRFPQCEITLVRYKGTEMGDEFMRQDVRTTLPEQIRLAEQFLADTMRKGSRMVGFEREDWTEYPLAAVREALVNAVAHRDYSVRGEGIRVALYADRLEVYSPGRLAGHITLENLLQERYSRNETLVQVLADLGLIERLGYGIDRMVRQMEEAGLPAPQFRETAAGFVVTLRGKGQHLPEGVTIDTSIWEQQGLNERQIAALVFLTEHRRITNRDLQELVPDVSPETIRRDLSDLVERGLLIKIGEKRATYYILK